MKHTTFVVLALLMIVVIAVSAQAGSAVLLSFPQLVEQREVEVTAGISYLVSITDGIKWSTRDKPTEIGEPVAYYKNGYLEIPTDSHGVFDDLQYLVIDPLVLGIKPKFIRKENKGSVTKIDGYVANQEWSGDLIVISLDDLQLGTHVMETSVVHGASKKVTRFFFFFKHSSRYRRMDQEAMIFSIVDASRYIEEYCHYQLGIVPADMTPEDVTAVRSAYYDSRMKGTLELTEPMLGYSLRADGMARERQGFPAGLSVGQARPDPEVMALRKELTGLRSSLNDWKGTVEEWKRAYEDEKVAREEFERLLAKKPEAMIDDFPSPTIETEGVEIVVPAEIENWQDELRTYYTGKTGWIFQLVGPDGEPIDAEKTVYLWLLVERGDGQMRWEPNTKNPVTITGHDVWFTTPKSEWKYFGVSFVDGKTPKRVFVPTSNELRILAISTKGGVPYEAH